MKKVSTLLILSLVSIVILISLAFISKEKDIKLIAHRGGVVESRFTENSPASVKEAIKRGYWMIEVDIRETKDGKVIVQHDVDFNRFYGMNNKVADMNWEEVKKLRAKPGNTAPLLFEELAALCKGKLQLMLDTKEPHSPQLLAEVEKTLRKNGLLDSAYVIGTKASREFFTGRAKVGADKKMLEQALQEGKDVSRLYFLFEHGNVLDKATVSWAQEKSITVVPSVNTFHYRTEDPIAGGKRDIEMLQSLGVTQFQIDSEYDTFIGQGH